MIDATKYPEHAKVQAIPIGEREAVADFFDYIIQDEMEVVRMNYEVDPPRVGKFYKKEELVFGFFKVDVKAFHKEKDRMVKELQDAANL